MPNYVLNKITIKCTPEKADLIIRELKGHDMDVDFNSLIPCPESALVGKLDGLMADKEYEWKVINWGVKWNAIGSSTEQVDNGLVLFFETAWHPPRPVVKEIVRRYGVDLVLDYAEEYMQDWGRNTYTGVMVTVDDPAECRNMIAEMFGLCEFI